jgi:hypothetical protein
MKHGKRLAVSGKRAGISRSPLTAHPEVAR